MRNVIGLYFLRPLHESYGEIKNSVISPVFLKNEVNSRAIERIFRDNRGNLSIFNPLYLSCKGLLLILLLQLTGCSSSPLQSNRLDTAESFIIQAEQALNGSPENNQVRIANENLGTANAYLLTLHDNRKRLGVNEHKRYLSLKQRADKLLQRIRGLL